MKKLTLIHLSFLLTLLIANACVVKSGFTPTVVYTLTLSVTPTPTSTPIINLIDGYNVLHSPDGIKKAIYDPYTEPSFDVLDANGTVIWSITYDTNKLKDIFREPPEPWLKPFYWSKDGRFLYYTCFHGQESDGSSKFYGNEFIDGCGIFRLDVKTGKTIDILPEIAPGDGYYAFSIAPDEKHLVYTNQNEMPVRIKLLDMITGQEQILLTAHDDILEIGRFGWSPKSDKLAFMTMKISADEKRFYSIFILDLNSLETKLLIKDFNTRIRFVSWNEQGVISYDPDDSGYIWQLSIESKMFSFVTPTPWTTSIPPIP